MQPCCTPFPIFGTPWTVAHQAPLSMGFSRQENWSRLPFPSPMHACRLSCFSRVRLCVTPWAAPHQAPLSSGFSRQEYWSGLPFLSPSIKTTSCKILGWMNHKLDSRLPGEILTTSDMQMIPLKWQKVKRN